MDLLGTANKALRHVLVARGVESLTTRVRGLPLHHYRLAGTGSGPPMLLLHGLGGSANGFYKTFWPLKDHFRAVHAVDLPGNGFSPLPSSGPVEMEEQVRLVLEFQRLVIGEPMFLVGNSLGGAMSLFAASQAPEAVCALALVSPAGAQVRPDRLQALIEDLDVTSTAQARALTRRLFHKVPLTLNLFGGQLRYLYGSAAVKGVIAQIRHADHVPPERFARLTMPTLLIWGQSEKLLPYESIDYFRTWLPRHAEVREVKGFGHVPQMEKPAELVTMLVDFARRQRLLAA